MNVELGPKRLELLHEVVPRATNMAVLINPANPLGETLLIELQEPARNLGLQLHALRANTEHDFETIFTTLRQLRAGGLVIATDIFFTIIPKANGSPRWRSATRCPRSIKIASSPPLAV